MQHKPNTAPPLPPITDDPLSIPLDADGAQPLLSLPTAPFSEESFRRRLNQFEEAWKAGNPPAIAEAVKLCFIFNRPPPTWLMWATFELADAKRSPEQVKRYNESQQHFWRYVLVRDIYRRGGVRYQKACEQAAAMMQVSPETVWASYKQVKRDRDAGRGGKYVALDYPRPSHSDDEVEPL